PLRSSASSSRDVVDLARPVAALSPVNVTGSAACTTSESSRAARSTAWVPFSLPIRLSHLPCSADPNVPYYGTKVLLYDPMRGSRIGQVSGCRGSEGPEASVGKQGEADVREHDAEV